MSETRLVRITNGPGRASSGTVLRVPRRTAESWIEQGIAEYATAPETAMLTAPEKAMLPRGRPRKGSRGRDGVTSP